ncbi:peroxidase 20 [Eucalyptus grandis]|uniref:Uncharacterized protein n=2 Tax=Eucalyptus grandis TaxID=71139 RepID=A0ACC3L810_EUCGR|nr:peroxidase 20 [Eucalyptus grandis]KAK3434708.1 hypothetical protein EUGRSUZ_D02157 [Eucalyptus grandis]
MGVLLSVLLLLSLYGVGTSGGEGALVLGYYQEKCPLLEEIVRHSVERAVYREPRMAASLLRVHFHDCFVMGCDASVLLDSFDGMVSEKQAVPNLNSLRGFEVIDEIKYNLEEACPYTVSCADILAIVARDAVELRGGPRWEVWLGRRDSLKASFDGANKFIPAPNSSLEALIANFGQQGLDERDLVALSGSHTMGKARCLSFRQGIYEESTERQYDPFQRYTTFYDTLQSICPETGSDNRLASLDHVTPFEFDNHYFLNLLQGTGLLPSDNALINEDHEGVISRLVWTYASDTEAFFRDFANSVVKMGNINVLTESGGEIRRTCRFINT